MLLPAGLLAAPPVPAPASLPGTPAALLEAGQPVRAEALLEDRVRTVEGHRPATFHLLGQAREARGDRTGAARAYRVAHFLMPTPVLGERLASWGEPLWPPPTDLFLELGELHRDHRRAFSLLWCGLARGVLELLAEWEDPVSLALRAAALGELGRFSEGELELAVLARMQPGRAITPYLRSNYAHWRGDSELEGRLLEVARRWRPDSPDVEGAAAARDVAAGNTRQVRRYLTWEQDAPGAGGPFRMVGRAAILTALGELDHARGVIRRLETLYPISPQTLVVRAGLELRAGRQVAGVRALGGLLEVAPGNILLLPAANLLAAVGRPALARRAIALLEPPLRDDPRVERMLALLATDAADGGEEKTGRFRGFRYHASAAMPAAVLERALDLLGEARETVDARLGRPFPGLAELVLVDTPGESPWGYYDAVTRRIVFRGDFRRSRLRGEAVDVLQHVARHEYAHMAFDHLVRGEGEEIVSYPRWMMEGIADQLAGGLAYLRAFGYRLEELDPAPLSRDQMARILAVPILGMGSIPQTDQARAYRQSHRMVGALLARLGDEDPWGRMIALVRRLGGGEDLDRVLREECGVGTASLLAEGTRAEAAASVGTPASAGEAGRKAAREP